MTGKTDAKDHQAHHDDADTATQSASTSADEKDSLVDSDESAGYPSSPDSGLPIASPEEGDSPPAEKQEEPTGRRELGEMTLVEHLKELRVRLMRCFLALLVGLVVAYNWAEELFQILMEPMAPLLKNSTFIYTHPTEAFVTYMKVAIVAGFFLVSPYIFYQFWLFVTPGLYKSERRWLIPIALCTAIFFTVGALFGYFAVFPAAFDFLAGYSNETIVFTPKLDEYLSFVLRMLFAFGIIFELPLVIFFMARLGMVDAPMLRKFRKWAILISFIVAAVLTPTPDALTQCLMAGPLLVLYEVSIWVAAAFSTRKRKVPEEALPDEDDGDEADEVGQASK